mmetsp:Transcript_73078/g.194146  ORF Transcript_73078/g.194146 Transcript_73078/m.194146 type:complete len:229 (-) Transcript_73078:11-697(-)
MSSTVRGLGAAGTEGSEKCAEVMQSMANSSSDNPDISAGSAKIASCAVSQRSPAWLCSCDSPAGPVASAFGACRSDASSWMRLRKAAKPNSSQMRRRSGALAALTPCDSHCAALSRSRGSSNALASLSTSQIPASVFGKDAPPGAPYTWWSKALAASGWLTPSNCSSRGSEATASASSAGRSRRVGRLSSTYLRSGKLAAARTAWWAGRRSPPTTRTRSQSLPWVWSS